MPSEAEMYRRLGLDSGTGKKARKGRKAAKTYARYDPDTGELARVTRDDDRYDEWLTPAQHRSAESKSESGAFGTRVAKEIGREIPKGLGFGARGAAGARKRAQVAKSAAGLAKSALPLVTRLGLVAGALGLVWWGLNKAHAIELRKKAIAQIAADEKRKGRQYSDAELGVLLDAYTKHFDYMDKHGPKAADIRKQIQFVSSGGK